jgi:hypothetical protein
LETNLDKFFILKIFRILIEKIKFKIKMNLKITLNENEIIYCENKLFEEKKERFFINNNIILNISLI